MDRGWEHANWVAVGPRNAERTSGSSRSVRHCQSLHKVRFNQLVFGHLPITSAVDGTLGLQGEGHSSDAVTDGTLACWGDAIGEPADATTDPYNTMTARGVHTCAIAIDGPITCWPRTTDGVDWTNAGG